ncbi:MAG: universal stress protein [Bacteroidetes bacterium]|nr:universal stress protein [Bacteroidota bacterium]
MKNGKKNILVPTDFTKVAECALGHAQVMAKNLDAEITLLHVVGKQSEVEEAKGKLKQIAQKASQESGININILARVGNIFDDIGDVASEIGALLIIMGTHGLRGLQYITGSHAHKVITHSTVPFVVVQEKGIKSGYDEIVLPLSFDKETKQKMKLTVEIAKSFKSKVFIITPKEDDEFLNNTIKRNLAFAKNYLAENRVPYEVKVAEKGNFAKQIIKYAVLVEADLIAIVNSNEPSLLPELFGGSKEQQMLTNEPQIPVLCVNPTEVSKSGGIIGS